MCGGGGGGVKIGGTAGQIIGGAERELKKAGKGLQGEVNKVTGGGKKGGGKGASTGSMGAVSTPTLKGLDFSNFNTPLKLELPKKLDVPKINPPSIKPPEVSLPKNNIPTPSAAPSINLDQDFNVGKALETNVNQAADQISAERDRAVQMDLTKMAEEEGQRALDAAATNVETFVSDVKTMGSDILEFFTGSRTVEDIKPGIQNTTGGDDPVTTSYQDYSSTSGRAGQGRGKKGSLRRDKTSKLESSKSKLYVKPRAK